MNDGALLPFQETAADQPRATLLALHGMGSHAGFFLSESAPDLRAGGLEVVAFDQRGHGRAPNRGVWAGEEALVGDAVSAIRLLRARRPDRPFFVLGESMGANVALLAADRLRASGEATLVDGWILLVPGFYTLDDMRPARAAPLRMVLATMPGIGGGNGAPTLGVSDNHESLARAQADRLAISSIRADLVAGVLDLHGATRPAVARCCAGPTLFLFGARDGVTEQEPTLAVLRSIPRGTGARVALYPEGWHVLLRDLQREVVAHDILAFTADPRRPLPSGGEAHAAEWVAGGP
ncbi:alpha/beta fold hydrolase [Roseomonas sp. AR75]|uniref:alpha/beta fold hydrolase n=1 Tax=Roseomonas sp. AR75 TaxID=2562311 RepID=UPI001485722F|nr:alpha/beta fold hydrolase [Roseomonas sp. AR75]